VTTRTISGGCAESETTVKTAAESRNGFTLAIGWAGAALIAGGPLVPLRRGVDERHCAIANRYHRAVSLYQPLGWAYSCVMVPKAGQQQEVS